jgi:hypothetical protein
MGWRVQTRNNGAHHTVKEKRPSNEGLLQECGWQDAGLNSGQEASALRARSLISSTLPTPGIMR